MWLVVYPLLSIFVSLMTYGLDYIDTTTPTLFKGYINHLYFGLAMSSIFSLMFVLMISMSRKSTIFWDYAKQLEEMANNVKTKEELEHIWYNEYNELVKKCQGGAQIGEVRRIRAIIETRLKYWK